MAEAFWDAFPAYLNMGMSSDEYWNGDAENCVAYRKAYDEKLKLADVMLWRGGLYTYHALCCVAPAFNSIKPRDPHPYIKPFGFEMRSNEEDEPKQETNPGLAFMKAWAARVNAMRKKQNG